MMLKLFDQGFMSVPSVSTSTPTHSTPPLDKLMPVWLPACLFWPLRFIDIPPCSVDDDLNVKVTDCALARDLFSQDYCCLGDNENRPVKWMAVESLEHHRNTVSSDVVSDV